MDFGLSTIDTVIVDPTDRRVYGHLAAPGGSAAVTPGSEGAEPLVSTLTTSIREANVALEEVRAIAVTGGQSRRLPPHLGGVPIVKVDEPTAIAVGGAIATGLTEAMVVSCGTGTAIVHARTVTSPDLGTTVVGHHVTGTAVGGGTLAGLGALLTGERDPLALARLAASGAASGVDVTLGEVLGGGVGRLPAEATAVNFGRIAAASKPASREDLAAGLVTMIGQVIALLAVAAARADGVHDIVATGRLATLQPVREVLDAVATLYALPSFTVPDEAPFATAWGAAVASHRARSGQVT